MSPIEEIIREARSGRIVILVDDRADSSSGDLVMPAQMTTPDAINFMATHGRGLICLALQQERVEKLGLKIMPSERRNRADECFATSIEARAGVSTGISVHDRARTISVAIDESTGADDIVTPGHVFPVVGRPGGVLMRPGNVEGAIDISRLAGFNPSATICRIMRPDGEVAGMPDLQELSTSFGLKIGSIRDLVSYRRKHDRLIERIGERSVSSLFGGPWRAIAFRNKHTGDETLAMVHGTIDPEKPTLVRMHMLSVFCDLFAEVDARTGILEQSMMQIAEAGSGIIVLINRFSANYVSQSLLSDRARINSDNELRELSGGAQILSELGVQQIILLSNTPHSLIAFEGNGLSIFEQRSICSQNQSVDPLWYGSSPR